MTALLDALTHLGNHRRLFLACSGGRDSLSLAYACHLLHQDGQLSTLPTLLHVHHGMQSANDDWAKHVKAWADRHQFDCHILPLQLTQKTETTARTARYQAMASVMRDGDVLLLAHHENDQAETLLMRLITGTGIHGLSGIKAWQHKTIQGKTIHLHRPWLSITRQDITDFAQAHALPYVDDPTNDTLDNARSFIRNDILPKLAQLNPKASTNIARCATLLAQSCAIIDPVIHHALDDCRLSHLSDEPYQSVLDVSLLSTFDDAHRSAMLHAWLSQDEPTPPPSQLIHQLMHLCQKTNTDHKTQIFWQGQRGYLICRYRTHLYRFWDKAWAYLQGNDSPLYLSIPPDARLLDTTDKILVPIHGMVRELSGKKLYQTLGVAPFFRRHLYVIDRPQGLYLLAPHQSWQLSGTAPIDDEIRWQMR